MDLKDQSKIHERSWLVWQAWFCGSQSGDVVAFVLIKLHGRINGNHYASSHPGLQNNRLCLLTLLVCHSSEFWNKQSSWAAYLPDDLAVQRWGISAARPEYIYDGNSCFADDKKRAFVRAYATWSGLFLDRISPISQPGRSIHSLLVYLWIINLKPESFPLIFAPHTADGAFFRAHHSRLRLTIAFRCAGAKYAKYGNVKRWTLRTFSLSPRLPPPLPS